MSSLLRRLAVFLLAALLSAIAAAQLLLVDETVAIIDPQGGAPRRNVLLSEVELEARLARVRQASELPVDAPATSEELARALEQLVERIILYVEAERLEVFRLTPEESDAVVASFKARAGGERFEAWLEASDVDAGTVSELVLRDARVERYLEGRFRLAARPRPADVAARWEADPAAFGGRTLEAARADVERELEARRFAELVSRFVTDVRRRAQVRVLRDFLSSEGDTPLHGSARAPEAQQEG